VDISLDRNGEVPLGTQLAWQIQALITSGRLHSGEQLPSVRRLAEVAGVNVNTVRSVYERLEGEGFVRTHHGRGTFVAENVPQLEPNAFATRLYGGAAAEPAGAAERGRLREQITALEARLAPHVGLGPGSRTATRPAVLSTEELAQIRDELVSRLDQLDAVRDDLVGLLASLRTAMGDTGEASAKPRLRARRTGPATWEAA
jgi:DNA-binding transcriptional regulator YhcF (GntR family)